MQGVFPILVTPFDEQSRVDEESLRHLVEFNIGAGVHGLGVALGSEVFRLSEAERRQVTRIVVDQARNQVPVVINTGAQGTDLAVLYSRTAEEAGTDGETPPPYLEAICDPVAPDGTVPVPQEPGMGYRLRWDYIDENRIPS